MQLARIPRLFVVTILLLSFVTAMVVHAQQSTAPAQFVLGPQIPVSSVWYDTTQVTRGRFHADAFPAIPPATYSDPYVMTHYYDLGLALYRLYARTSDPADLARARKVTDSWWANSWWIDNGNKRLWLQGTVSPPPRHAGLGGLILRALDGRPEMWGWINEYTRFHFDHWVKKRVTSATLFYGLREGAFMLHAATWLAKAHPDAAIRAVYLADVEAASVQYYGRLQQTDGSWRWDDFDYKDSDGGTLKGVMQPFMVGLLLNALVDVHRLSTNETVRSNVLNQIVKGCKHLYTSGAYTTQLVPSLNVRIRGFHYFYHGGTSVNPTRYENGSTAPNWDTTGRSGVQNHRQAISTMIVAFAYAAQFDPTIKPMAADLWDAAYGPSDGVRNYMAGDAKSYNQNALASSYQAWIAGTPAPGPAPTPVPTPAASPSPTATPFPSPTVTPTPLPSPVVTPTATPTPNPSPSPLPSPTPIPTPVPTPAPTPVPCSLTVPASVSVPRWGSRIITVTITMSGGASVSAIPLSGQATVSPRSRTVSGTGATIDFQISVKNNSSSVRFDSPCGSKTMEVVVER